MHLWNIMYKGCETMKIIRGIFKGSIRKMKTLEKTRILENTKIIENNIEPEWAQLCSECYLATQKNNWTKADSRQLLKEVRKELKEIEAY